MVIAIKTMAYINKFIRSKFCAEFALVQRCTSNSSRHEDNARVSLELASQMWKKDLVISLSLFKTTNNAEFRLSNINFSSVNEEFSSSEAYFFTFVISLFHKWKSFLASVKVTRCKVLYNSYPL